MCHDYFSRGSFEAILQLLTVILIGLKGDVGRGKRTLQLNVHVRKGLSLLMINARKYLIEV